MQLLQELFSVDSTNRLLNESVDFLFEDLGTLKQIDSELLGAMKSSYRKWIKNNAGQESQKEILSLGKTLGNNSPLKTTEIKNIKSAFSKFEDPDNRAIGLVFRLNGEQIFSMSNAPAILGRSGKYSPDYIVSFKSTYSDVLGKEAYQELASKIYSGFSLPSRMEIDSKKAYSIINAFIRAAKANEATIDALMILADKDRMEKHNSRENVRQGRVPLPGEGMEKNQAYGSFIKNAKYDLQKRLESFKAGKADDFGGDVNAMLEKIVKDGYVEKFKFDGYTYKFKDSNFRMEVKGKDAKAKNWASNESYVEYQFDNNQPTETINKLKSNLEKLKTELKDKYSEAEKDAMWDEYYDKKKEVMPPGEIKFILGFEGGKIVPTEVKFGEGSIMLSLM